MGLPTNSEQPPTKWRHCLTKEALKSNSTMASARWDISMAAEAKWPCHLRRPRIGPRRVWHMRNGASPLRHPRNAHTNGGSYEMVWVSGEGCKVSMLQSYKHALGAWGGMVGVDELCNIGNGGGINVEENLNRLDEVHIATHLIHKPARVLTPHGTLVDVFTSESTDPSMDLRRQRLEPYF
ncbi:uncharacterized protein DS421_14g474010 [Arachis hypogaea]|nr:uncharacterized protein DS421_14g474010 [Arachis hypogaea]